MVQSKTKSYDKNKYVFWKQKAVLISDLISELHVGVLELSIVHVMLLMD